MNSGRNQIESHGNLGDYTRMQAGGQTIIIAGQGTCSECNEYFFGEPMAVHTALRAHATNTGHDVYGETEQAFRESLRTAATDAFVDLVVEHPEWSL